MGVMCIDINISVEPVYPLEQSMFYQCVPKPRVPPFSTRSSISCTQSVVSWLSAKGRWVVGAAFIIRNSFDEIDWLNDAELASLDMA